MINTFLIDGLFDVIEWRPRQEVSNVKSARRGVKPGLFIELLHYLHQGMAQLRVGA